MSQPTVSHLLFLMLRINEIRCNRKQAILDRPISHTSPLHPSTPMLPIFRLAQMQRLRRPILRRKGQEHVAVFARLLGRPRRLVLDHIIRPSILFRRCLLRETKLWEWQNGQGFLRDGHVGGDPVAHFAPFGVVARWRIRIRECDYIGHLLRLVVASHSVGDAVQDNVWLVL